MRSKFFSSLIFVTIAACQSGPVDDPIPLANFSPLVLNLSFPENEALFLDGGSRTINSIGVRGVIVATRRLENLATRLLAMGEDDLAQQAQAEARRVAHTSNLSDKGRKTLKYQTRFLLLGPSAQGSEEE